GKVQAGAASVVLTPNKLTNTLAVVSPGGVATTTVAQSDLDAISTTNFVVLGSSNNLFAGNTIIGQTATVDGKGKSLGFFRVATAPTTATTTIGAQGLTTSGDVVVNAGPGSIV